MNDINTWEQITKLLIEAIASKLYSVVRRPMLNLQTQIFNLKISFANTEPYIFKHNTYP